MPSDPAGSNSGLFALLTARMSVTTTSVLEPIRETIIRTLGESEASGTADIAEDDFETYTGARVRAPNFAPAWFFNDDAEIVQQALIGLHRAGINAELTHYAFCTNGSGTAGRLNIPTIGFGPGDESLAHRADEYISVDNLVMAARGYAAMAEQLTSRGG